MAANSLWTPVGHNAGKPNLFGVVGNIRPKTENRTPKEPIGAFYDFWLRHVRLEWCKDQAEATVVKLSTEYLKLGPSSLAFARLIMVHLSMTKTRRQGKISPTFWNWKEGNRDYAVPMSTPSSICYVAE